MVRPLCSVLGTQYAASCTRKTLRAGFLLLLAISGCSSSSELPADVEASLADQLQLVASGQAETIHLESTPVTDEQLVQLAAAPDLRTLLLDSAESRITAAGIRHLTTLKNLQHFRCRAATIDDPALAEIAKIDGLQILNLPQAVAISDQGLAHLAALPNLVQLRFAGSAVTDAGISTLANIQNLARLHLINVPITGEGLKSLAKIEQLESLYIDGGSFTDADVDALFAARPKLHVHFNQRHHDRDPHNHAH